MPDETTILSLPLILPAQAQKHVTHNEALAQLDLIVQLTVIDRVRTTAPGLPAVGDRHIVAPGATGPWAGQEGRIALYTATGWQFTQALPGWRAHVLTEGQTAVFDGLGWTALSDGELEVAQLGISASPDATNRLVVSSAATLLNHAGAGHQLKLNKAAAGDTASLLFQTGFGGRAEMGTAGSDDFGVKVSPDGGTWFTGLEVDGASGEVTLPQPLHLGGQPVDPVAPPDGTLWLNTASGEVRVRSGGVTLPVGGGGAGGIADGDKGDITVSGGGASWTVEAGAIDNAKLAAMASGTIKGRASAGAGEPEDLTAAQVTALLETFSSSAKGVVPASGGGTESFLRADGTWAAPAGGGAGDVVGPAGATDRALARFDGATGKLLQASPVTLTDDGMLTLPAVSLPVPPMGDQLALYARSVGGRMLPVTMGPAGLDSPLQPHLGLNRAIWWIPHGNNTTASNMGITAAATGAMTAVNVATGSLLTMMRRISFRVNTASTTAVVGWRGSNNQHSVGGTAAGLGGFHMIVRWGGDTGMANASHRCFVGMRPTAVPTDVEPSNLTSIVGVGYDAGDTTFQILSNDASGTATKISLGASFPKPSVDAQDAYELVLFSPPGPVQIVHYRMRNLSTGAEATGMVTADLPPATTLLAPFLSLSAGGVSSVIGLTVMCVYIETDY